MKIQENQNRKNQAVSAFSDKTYPQERHKLSLSLSFSLSLFLSLYIYIYIYMCVCVCIAWIEKEK